LIHFRPIWLAVVGSGVIVSSIAMPMGAADAAIAAKASTAKATSDIPVGIRTGIVRVAMTKIKDKDDNNGAGRQRDIEAIAFADSEGHFIYLSSTDCTGACLQKWQPASAATGAHPAGDWSLVGQDGKRQWAFRGQPAYFHVGGPEVGQPTVMPASSPTQPPEMGVTVNNDGQDGMHLAVVAPETWIDTPFEIGVAEYRLAPGQILAAGVAGNNPMGKPLYVFSGTPQQEQKLPGMFKPQYAATLDLPLGDFTIRERSDGSRQWVFHGSALYTCSCDISVGDLNGKGAAPGITPATLLRYPTPSQVALKKDKLSVGYIVEASTGKTLYFRDRLKDNYTPDHARPMLGTQDPGIGALLNTKHCDAQCEKEWHPLWAPQNAQPEGYWSVYMRPDGKRQWAYKNSALYTHASEPPGSLDGNETYTIAFDNGLRTKPVPEEFGLGLEWRALVP
jgi:predicted lipoprotein with Yx(FWY)xxD motif